MLQKKRAQISRRYTTHHLLKCTEEEIDSIITEILKKLTTQTYDEANILYYYNFKVIMMRKFLMHNIQCYAYQINL